MIDLYFSNPYIVDSKMVSDQKQQEILNVIDFHCSHCRIKLASEHELKGHLMQLHKFAHVKEAQVFSCEHCPKQFKNKNSLLNHISHYKNTKTFKCDLCDQEISKSLTNLQRHKDTVHSKVEVNCSICKKGFNYKDALNSHMKRMHSKGANTYKCELCSKYLRNKINLRIHVQSQHTNEKKSFKCEFCNIHLSSNSYLKKHVNTVHLKKQNFRCNECHMTFGLEENLKRHVRYVHEIEAVYCDVCNKEFKNKPRLKDHMRCHTDKKSYECH